MRLSIANRAIIGLLVSCASLASLAQDNESRLNKAIELLENDQPAFGVLAFDYSLNNARSLSRSGLDFIIIDMEHAPFDIERLREFLLGMTDKRAIARKGNLQPEVVPIVRIPATGREDILAQAKQVLDVGAFGVMYPSINNADEAKVAVQATRYPQLSGSADFEPKGLRGRNPSNAVWYWGIDDYYQKADVWPLDEQGELLAVIQIETQAGVNNIDEILDVPGVGVVFIGPSDLSADMGYANAGADAVEQAIQTVLASCLRTGIACAITTNRNSVEERLAQGFRFVTVGLDGGLSARTDEALRLGREAANQQVRDEAPQPRNQPY